VSGVTCRWQNLCIRIVATINLRRYNMFSIPPVNRVRTFGSFHDWPHSHKRVLGYFIHPSSNTWGARVINRTNKKVNGKYLPGGDWYAWRTSFTHDYKEYAVYRPQFGLAYTGGFITNLTTQFVGEWENPFKSSTFQADIMDELRGFGSQYWDKARPAKPDFTLAGSLAELKDIPGALKQGVQTVIESILRHKPRWYFDFGINRFRHRSNRKIVSHTAEWYLAINFGWIPVVKDIQNYIEAQKLGQESLRQLIRDAGRPVKRRREIKEISENLIPLTYQKLDLNTSFNPYMEPVLVTQCYGYRKAKIEAEFDVTRKAWFTAEYQYYLPPGPRDVEWTRNMLNRLMGSRVTPSTAWNLMPWTFLADYYSTLGTAIENLGPGVESYLVTNWCYVHCAINARHKTLCTQYVRSSEHESSADTPVTAKKTADISLRVRVSADPFAFRFKKEDQSIKQLAIQGALVASM